MTDEQKLAAVRVWKFYRRELRWCSCGDSEAVMIFMRDVLEAIRWNFDEGQPENFGGSQERSYTAYKKRIRPLLGEIGSPVCLSYFYMLDAANLTEHGGGVMNGGWLSNKGSALLNDLKLLGDLEWDTESIAKLVYDYEHD